MERSSFYISHFFGARSKCLKLWVFRLGASRGIFFAVCCHFLFGGGGGRKKITDFVELCTWKSRLEIERVPVMNCKHEPIIQKFKIRIRFAFVCFCVFMLEMYLEIQISVLKNSANSLLHSVVD